MTVSILADRTAADRTPDLRSHLLPALEAATVAVRDAHEAARALTDLLLACRRLPGEVYGYAPDVARTTATLTAATRAAAGAARSASADPSPERLGTLHRATEDVARATAAARAAVEGLRAAAEWFGRGQSALGTGAGSASGRG